jgi:hypothetical protein
LLLLPPCPLFFQCLFCISVSFAPCPIFFPPVATTKLHSRVIDPGSDENDENVWVVRLCVFLCICVCLRVSVCLYVCMYVLYVCVYVSWWL